MSQIEFNVATWRWLSNFGHSCKWGFWSQIRIWCTFKYDNKGLSVVVNRIEACRTYQLYKFVRSELVTQLLSGWLTVSSGTEIENWSGVLGYTSQGRLIRPLLQCVEGWNPLQHQWIMSHGEFGVIRLIEKNVTWLAAMVVRLSLAIDWRWNHSWWRLQFCSCQSDSWY